MSSLSLKGAEKFFAQTMTNSSDEEQAAFFNEFGRLLPIACGKSLGADNQYCYIAASLDRNGREMVKQLAAFVVLAEEADCKR